MLPITKKLYQVAVILYDHADILDFAGPVEILTHTQYSDDNTPIFKTHLIGNSTIRAGGAMSVNTELSFGEATEKIEDFDILIVPGGPPDALMNMVEQGDPVIQYVKAFTSQKIRATGEERIVLSVCTGALLLAAAGVLKGVKATTHHLALDTLRQLEPSAEVISNIDDSGVPRYVDGGLDGQGMRFITAGGVTCGLDASLYVGELKGGRDSADRAAKMTEHDWKRI